MKPFYYNFPVLLTFEVLFSTVNSSNLVTCNYSLKEKLKLSKLVSLIYWVNVSEMNVVVPLFLINKTAMPNY